MALAPRDATDTLARNEARDLRFQGETGMFLRRLPPLAALAAVLLAAPAAFAVIDHDPPPSKVPAYIQKGVDSRATSIVCTLHAAAFPGGRCS